MSARAPVASTLDLAARGVAVVALDADPALLQALEHRAAGLPVETVVADAREFALGRRFSLVIVPMQTLQLLGGPRGRAAFLRCALDHLEPGGRLAAALADAMDCFDEEHDMPPPPDAFEIGDVRYASRLLAVVDEGGRAAIHRRREVIGPGGALRVRGRRGAAGPSLRATTSPPRRAQLGLPHEPHLLRTRDRASTSDRRWSSSAHPEAAGQTPRSTSMRCSSAASVNAA